MLSVTHSSLLPWPREEIFPVAADPERQLEWDAGTLKRVEKISPGPLGEGARYRGTFKGFGELEYDFVAYLPPAEFTHATTMRMGRMRHTFRFEPEPGGTRLTQIGRLAPNLLGRLMTPLIRLMLRRRFKRIAEELVAYLRTHPKPR